MFTLRKDVGVYQFIIVPFNVPYTFFLCIFLWYTGPLPWVPFS